MNKISVLFVCLGNICRSPTAEGVFRKKIEQHGLLDRVTIDSAGTSDWHIGSLPDKRTIQAAKNRGYDLSSLRGRQVTHEDLLTFDYVLAMDGDNLALLISMDIEPSAKVELFLKYGDANDIVDVPDPYHDGEEGFEQVLNLVEQACDGLLSEIQQQLDDT